MTSSTVFISYAAADPDWSVVDVRRLGETIRASGCEVLLDQFQLETHGERLSDAEWMEWMEQSVSRADRVLCLCSPRYLQASRRDVTEDFGRGVAQELLDLIYRLYQDKSRNASRVWAVIRDGHDRKTSVPSRLMADCPWYHLPGDQLEMLKSLSGAGLPVVAPEGAAVDVLTPAPGPTSAQPLRRHHIAAVAHLAKAPSLWLALQSDDVFDTPPPVDCLKAPDAFARWLVHAPADAVREAMWAVRRAYDKNRVATPEVLQANRTATVALYLLAACRLVVTTSERHADALQKVPIFDGKTEHVFLYSAVIATALAGGELRLERTDGSAPRPANAYGVRLQGDNVDALFERALYAQVFNTSHAVAQALLDSPLTESEREQLVARLNHIRKVRRESLTLVILAASAAPNQPPTLGRELGVPVFICGDAVSCTLTGLLPKELVAELNQLWSEIDQADGAASAPDNDAAVAQTLDELRQSLTEQMSKLPADQQKALAQHVQALWATASEHTPKAERKDRANQALKGIETAAKTGEQSEKLLRLAMKVYELIKPLF